MSREREFPKVIARLDGLEGGQYGEIILKALTRHRMELELGNDFVTFTRVEATKLRDAVTHFLDLERECEERREEKQEERKEERVLGHAVKEIAEVVAHEVAETRPRRRKRS
ncbi:MAG: hypothetical protein ACRELY_03805 [Polyangiaceae bacterium]